MESKNGKPSTLKEKPHGKDGELPTVGEDDLPSGWTPMFILVMMVSYMCIPGISYSIASLNAPVHLIQDFMNATEVERNGEGLTKSEAESLFGLLVAVVGLGAIVGSLTSSHLADCLGRKLSIMLSSFTGLCGALIMALSEQAGSYEMLYVGRVLIGLTTGWGLSNAPAYAVELGLPSMRGTVALMNQMLQSFAFVIAQVLGYQELLGNEGYWTYLLGFPVVLFGLQLLLFPFCPESPRYLLFNKEDEEGATKAFQTVRSRKNVKPDIALLQAELQESSTEAQVSIIRLFVTPSLRRPLIIAIVMGLHQNWCGMAGVLFFSTELFEDAGVSGKASRYATSGTGITFFIGNIIAIFLLPRFGRKTLFMMGTIGMGVCSAIFALTRVFQEELDALKYVNIVIALMIIAFYALGPICVFWVILSEIYPYSARGAGFSVAILCAFIGFFTNCYIFPEMLAGMGFYTFFVFTGIDTAMAIFVFVYIPETRNKSFAEIAKSWAEEGEIENELEIGTAQGIVVTEPVENGVSDKNISKNQQKY